jgi:hypothetical protein
MLAASLAVSGCGSKKERAPAAGAGAATPTTTATAPPPTPPPTTTPAPAPPSTPAAIAVPAMARRDLGAVSAEPATTAESLPALAIVDGQPALAYRRGAAAVAARWTGDAWQPIAGDALCPEPVALAIVAAGAGSRDVVMAGAEAGRGNCVARSEGGAWTDTGVALADPTFHIADARLIATRAGPVAVLHHDGDQGDGLVFVRRGDTGWQQISAAFVADGIRVSSFDATGRGELVYAAWIERGPQQPPRARAQRLNVVTATLSELPSPGAADDTTALRLAAADDGTLYAARTGRPGLEEVLRLPLDALAWTSLGAPPGPRPLTAHGLPVIAVGPGGAPVLAWAGELIDVAVHDGAGWRELVTGIGGGPHLQSELRVAADGSTIALAWQEADPGAGAPPRIKATLLVPGPTR